MRGWIVRSVVSLHQVLIENSSVFFAIARPHSHRRLHAVSVTSCVNVAERALLACLISAPVVYSICMQDPETKGLPRPTIATETLQRSSRKQSRVLAWKRGMFL